jgi:hypothetical protein
MVRGFVGFLPALLVTRWVVFILRACVAMVLCVVVILGKPELSVRRSKTASEFSRVEM